MNYQIVATLGPASRSDDAILALAAAGASGFRLNSSHLSPPELRSWLVRLEKLLFRLEPVPYLVVDLQGTKRRLGRFAARELAEQDAVELVCAGQSRDGRTLPLPWPELFRSAGRGDRLLLNDAKIVLLIEAASPRRLAARVLAGGPVSARKGVTWRPAQASGRAPLPRVGEGAGDEAFIAASESHAFVRYALSYAESPAELASLRARCPAPRRLIAKLETERGLAAAAALAAESDELWLCRGDLGAELGAVRMAAAVRGFSRSLPALPAPALLAGQVLEHMTDHPQPTRSEVCHLADLLAAGYAGIVLSDETAVGRYPEESCRTAALFRETADL
jgi:pyruvate kinase